MVSNCYIHRPGLKTLKLSGTLSTAIMPPENFMSVSAPTYGYISRVFALIADPLVKSKSRLHIIFWFTL